MTPLHTMTLSARILLDRSTPERILSILSQAAGISRQNIEVYDLESQRVLLSHALIPTLLLRRNSFHPWTNSLLVDALNLCKPPPSGDFRRRVFLTQATPRGPNARECINEADLLEIAEQRHGFLRIWIDRMDWTRQIALFRDAEIVLSNATHPVFAALFCGHGAQFGSLGFTTLYPSQVGTFRGLRNSYFTLGTESTARYSANPKAFSTFLDLLCR
jgi:capsular polysaccharide biosynthesis protein